MKDFFINKIEKALNRYLSLDPESENRMRALQDKIVVIDLIIAPRYARTELGRSFGAKSAPQNDAFGVFAIQFNNHKIEILSSLPEKPDIVIKGMPLSLLGLSLSKDKRKHFFGDNVVIEGNLELGQQVTDLFDQLEIDWEEPLSRWVGDVPAHQVGRMVRNVKDFAERFCDSMARNVTEYVHEETELFPPSEALKDFYHDVDVLRMDVDRIEARIEKIIRGGE